MLEIIEDNCLKVSDASAEDNKDKMEAKFNECLQSLVVTLTGTKAIQRKICQQQPMHRVCLFVRRFSSGVFAYDRTFSLVAYVVFQFLQYPA